MGIDWTCILRFLSKCLIPIGILREATDFTNVQYENKEGTMLHAYLAKPPDFDASKSYPAAIVLHAWNGMSEEPVYFADLLAERGFIAMAPDMFRNIAACEIDIPWNIATTLLTPQDRIDDDIDEAISYLTLGAVGNVDTTKIVSGPGFCYGGSQALALSIRRAMAATVTLYGADIDELQDPDNDGIWGSLGVFGTHVLGIYGTDDRAPSPDEARGFEAAMNARNISNTVTIFDGVGHAFVNPDDHRDGKTQAVDAWDQVIAFMLEVANGEGLPARRALDIAEASFPHHSSAPSFSWLWDHTMDLFQKKGHFGHHQHHSLRKRQNTP